MDFKPLTKNELQKIMAIARSCGKHLESQGIYQWHEHYPAESDFQNDLDLNRLWGCWEKDQLLGFVVYTQQMSPAYKEVPWECEQSPNAYVHRLAVDPAFQRRGIASAMMSFCEDKAMENSCKSIRLDAYSRNPINLNFYEQRNYSRCGEVFYLHKHPHPFICFEKTFEKGLLP